MKDVKLVAAFAENKPGQVAHFTKILANANINIRWLDRGQHRPVWRHEIPRQRSRSGPAKPLNTKA
jgi:hypothetical protein